MKTETINLYKFEELGKEAQDKAVMDIANDPYYLDYDWWDFMHEDFKERLKEIGVECSNFYWEIDRGSYFRMDNARIVDEQLFLKSGGLQKELIVSTLDGSKDYTNIVLSLYEQRECTNRVEVEYDCYDDYEEVLERLKENFGSEEELAEKLTDYLQNILEGFLKELKDEYENMTSEEYIREDLISRDNDYTCDGEIW